MNSENKFTPGPWEIRKDFQEEEGCWYVVADGFTVCRVPVCNIKGDLLQEGVDTAQLIAVAQEIFKMLQAVKNMHSLSASELCTYSLEIEELIKKATGAKQ